MKIVISTTPKPFNETNIVRQTNCLRSLAALQIEKEILLFGSPDDAIAMGLCKNLNINYITEYKHAEKSHMPYINDVFYQTQEWSKADFYMFTNCDMIYLQDLIETLEFINGLKTDQKKFVCGRRWDTDDIKEIIDFETTDVMTKIASKELHSSFGIDYFIFQKDTFLNMPDFLLARTKFDNYILGHAIQNNHIMEIDTTKTIFCIHQNHDYGLHSNLTPEENVNDHLQEFRHNERTKNTDYSYLASIDGCRNFTDIEKGIILLKRK